MEKTELYTLLQTPGQGLQEGMNLLLGLKRSELVEMANDLDIDVFEDESNKVIRHNIVMFGFFLTRQLRAVRKMSRRGWKRNYTEDDISTAIEGREENGLS